MNLLRDLLLVAGKDLRIERRSRVALQQILPFGLVYLQALLSRLPNIWVRRTGSAFR